MNRSLGLAQSLSETPTETSPAEPFARPKVMRRPSRFSETTNLAIDPVAAPVSDASPEAFSHGFSLPVPVADPQQPWQDDARFGIVMIAIVLLVNLLLMAWLPHVKRPATVPNAPLVSTKYSSTIENEGGDVTIYSNPSITPPHALRQVNAEETPLADEPTPTVHVLGAE